MEPSRFTREQGTDVAVTGLHDQYGVNSPANDNQPKEKTAKARADKVA